MKTIYQALLGCILLSIPAQIQAQGTSKPPYFDAWPNELSLSVQNLEQAMLQDEGARVNLLMGNDTQFTGILISRKQVYSNLFTVMIKSTQFPDAILSLSRISDEQNRVRYSGRLLPQGSSDGFVMQRSESGYSLKKIQIQTVMQDCSF